VRTATLLLIALAGAWMLAGSLADLNYWRRGALPRQRTTDDSMFSRWVRPGFLGLSCPLTLALIRVTHGPVR
jgi:hypothetical protein